MDPNQTAPTPTTPPPATTTTTAGTISRSWRYRLYPTRRQEAELERQLGVACDIWNAPLEQRRRMWRDHGMSIGYREQSRQLTEARAELPELAGMNALAQHQVLRRLDRAFTAFYRRLAAGEKPGYPRFRARARYDSITWAQYRNGARIFDVGERNGRLYLQGGGAVKFRAHRPLPEDAKLGQVTVRRKNGRWWVTIALELPARERSGGDQTPGSARVVGVDLGVHTFAALSTGELIEGPRAGRTARRALRRARRKVTRRQEPQTTRAASRPNTLDSGPESPRAHNEALQSPESRHSRQRPRICTATQATNCHPARERKFLTPKRVLASKS